MTMTKADLVETVAEAADMPRKQADEVVQVILESIPRTTQKDPVLQTWEVSQGRAPPTVIGGGRDSLRPMAARIRFGG